ncbi:MAG: hypothetical protein RLZ45_36, partial [Verrucomicrobiota bacterium]
GVFLQKPPQIDGLALEVFPEVDRSAVHGWSEVIAHGPSSIRRGTPSAERSGGHHLWLVARFTTMKLPKKNL